MKQTGTKKQSNKKKRKSSSSQKRGTSKKSCMNNNTGANTNTNINIEEHQKNTHQKPTLSLASRLKRARGTAGTTPLPPPWSGGKQGLKRNFLTPEEDGDEFSSCHKECYKGFCWDEPDEIPHSIHDNFTNALDTMNDSGLFLYDVVQPGGKRSSLTFVTRTLVGMPGSTYKYLGLRLFSHPWCAVDEKFEKKEKYDKQSEIENLIKLGYDKNCARALIKIGQLNHTLVHRTNEKLETQIKSTVKDELVGSADFTITLINKMEPTSIKKDLKAENLHGLGKTSVSWHKDSGLQDFSSIAVYHTLQNIHEENVASEIPWKVALRVADPNTKDTPALSVPLPSGACYYLLDDFNHQHEHAVISGSNKLRYSSTHRVARDGSGTYTFIREKCQNILSTPLVSLMLKDGSIEILSQYNTIPLQKKLMKEVRQCLQLLHELEFEWLRMWYVQGRHHADLHPFWHQPIQNMESTFKKITLVMSMIQSTLKKQSETKLAFLSEDLYDVNIESIGSRNKLRAEWEQRLQDKIFASMSKQMQPLSFDLFDDMEAKPSVNDIRKWRSSFMKQQVDTSASNVAKKNSAKTASMTKKERKKVPSNWQRMQSTLKKKK